MKTCRLISFLPMSATAISLLLPMVAFGADAASAPVNVNAAEIKWGDAPPSLPKGAQAAILDGDPGKPGPFIIRLKAPAGYKVPPHWHSKDENLTVISGTFNVGMGDTLDPAKAQAVNAGGFHHIPATAHHYAFAKGPTIIQVNGEGPFDITYVNPNDDPRKTAGK